jgi:hypothetical protein
VKVPTIPSIDRDLLEDHAVAHAALAEAHAAADDWERRAFSLLQLRLVIESLAYLQPVSNRPTAQLLFPSPRAFLTRTQELRLEGATAAFRHIDSRVAMKHLGTVSSVLDRTTPLVLHALLEGPTPSRRETNPGMLRATPTSWKLETNPYMHPPATMCEDLVEAALDRVTSDTAPACVRAAWLTFAMLSIHPFVDGNGRTSRALYLAVAADELPLGVDWGILEQWSVARYAYVDALQAGQQVESYDAQRLDARPFVEFSTEASAVGARLCTQRLARVARSLSSLEVAHELSRPLAGVIVAVQILRVATLEQIASLGLAPPDVDVAVAELLDRGLLEWKPRPFGRRTKESAEPQGLSWSGPTP